MIFRQAEEADTDQVLTLYQQAQDYFRDNGIDQWQDGYPNQESLAEDMGSKESYVLYSETEDRILATALISLRPEPDYEKIYDGNWISDGPYGVMHRVAVAADCKGQGLGGIMIRHAADLFRQCGMKSIRIDTHSDNRSMQRMLKKNGFIQCGRIILRRDGCERLAYEMKL